MNVCAPGRYVDKTSSEAVKLSTTTLVFSSSGVKHVEVGCRVTSRRKDGANRSLKGVKELNISVGHGSIIIKIKRT